MTATIAIYGGSFNPPGRHHAAIARALAAHVDEVLVVPCGPRPDKPTSDAIDPVHRAAMCDIAFRDIEGVRVELFDLEQATFTPSLLLEEHFCEQGEVWHVVHADMIVGGGVGRSRIHTQWHHGEEVWARCRFIVVARPDAAVEAGDLPPQSRVVRVEREGSSAAIRERLFKRQDVGDDLRCGVAAYIDRYRLYRGVVPNRVTSLNMEAPRALLFLDWRNGKASTWAREFERWLEPEDPNCVIVLGGDGTMLAAVQEHWSLRVPFIGVNAGHLGFLLNKADDVLDGRFPPERLVVRHLPMIYVETQDPEGRWSEHLTFNDAWVERSTGQSAWLEVKVNGEVRMPHLICDGALVSTAAASTAYARSMGATPLLAETPAWLLVGSNVMQPMNWTSALLSLDARVEIRALDPDKRPLRGYVHGVPCGEVVAMRARMSRIASAELAFYPEHDMAEKLAEIQFPSEGQLF